MELLILVAAALCAAPAAAQSFVPPDAAAQIDAAVAGAKAAQDYCAIDSAGDHRVECREWMLKNVRVVDDATLARMRHDPDRAPTWTQIEPDDLYSLMNFGRVGWRGGYFLEAVVQVVGGDYDAHGRPHDQCALVVNQDRTRMLPLSDWLVKDSSGALWMPAAFIQHYYYVRCP